MNLQNNEIHNVQNTQESPQKRILVECRDVFKIYKQKDLETFALRALNLVVYEGEIVLIMGPSGSGKTTLLHVIAGLEKVSAGLVKYKSLDLTRLKEAQLELLLQKEIGIVFQTLNLIPTLTVFGNVELPMIISNMKEDQQFHQVQQLLMQVQLEKKAFSRPFMLSGGERQRTAIAMALANNPTLLLADEPTGNLDSQNASQILELFKSLIQINPNRSLIIVSHNPIFQQIANRVLSLKDGTIIHEEIITK